MDANTLKTASIESWLLYLWIVVIKYINPYGGLWRISHGAILTI